MELKTLKEIKLPEDFSWEGKVIKNSIRQEAIKWVKSFEEHTYGSFPGESCNCDPGLPCFVIQNWIKHFFNLTEEDLC